MFLLLQLLTPHFVEESIKLLYGALTAILLIFGGDLLDRYIRADKSTRNDAAYLVFFVIAMGLIGYGLYMIPALINYVYYKDAPIDGVVMLQQLVVIIILVPFSVVAEKILNRKKVHSIISAIVGIAATLYLLVITAYEFYDPTIISEETIDKLLIPAWIAFGFFGLFGFLGLMRIFYLMAPQLEVKKKIYMGLISGIVAVLGSLFAAINRPYLNEIFLLCVIIELVGWLFLRFFFLSIPSYSELEWKSGIFEMHVIMEGTGISIFNRKFRALQTEPKEKAPDWMKGEEKDKETGGMPDSDLIGGGMIGISAMISEITGSKGGVDNIQVHDKTIVFKHGKHLFCILVTDKNLGVYHSILYNIVQDLEENNPGLANFSGDRRSLKIVPTVDKYLGMLEYKKDPDQGP